jgi:hypothetical protein
MKNSPLRVFATLSMIPMLVACLENGGSGDAGGITVSSSGQTIVTHTVGATQYTWTFTCAGSTCLAGTFVGGDYWIAPKQVGEPIILISVTTTGTDAGLEINPSTSNTQGFLSCVVGSSNPTVAASYVPSLNKAGSMPLTVAVNQSLVKATQKASGCPVLGSYGLNNGGTTNCCIDSYDVVTVLPSAPISNGLDAFRPGFAGAAKTVYYLSDFNVAALAGLPNAAAVTAINNDLSYEYGDDSFSAVHTRWHIPFVDHYMQSLGDAGRLFVPLGTPSFSGNLSSGYGADLSSAYVGNMIRRAMGTEPWATKKPAVTGLLQRGIDLWASYNAGIRWPSGAGQQLGRKPPVAFFAALVNDAGIKAAVSALAANGNDDFHEDGQVQVRAGGIPIWGDVMGSSCSLENNYWANLFAEHRYDGNVLAVPALGSGDTVRTCADPYGYIDGPGGLPGFEYMEVSAGPLIGYQVAQSLMPDLCSAANDPDLSTFTRRLVQFGVHTSPDICAGPDNREPIACSPYTGANCQYYGPAAPVTPTWGPNGAGGCIAPNGTTTVPRFLSKHHTSMTQIFNEPVIARILRGGVAGSTYMGLCN